MTSDECAHPSTRILDWYANGSLAGAEEAEVAAHLRACIECSRQVAALSALVKVLSESDLAAAALAEPRGGRPGRWFAPAAIAVAALVVVTSFAAFRIAGPPGGATAVVEGGSARSAANLDLGDGMSRGTARQPVLVATPGITEISITLRVPVAGFEPDVVIVTGPDGDILHSEPFPGVQDQFGGYTGIFPARAFARPGDYRLIVRETRAGGDPRDLPYPFRVETPRGSVAP